MADDLLKLIGGDDGPIGVLRKCSRDFIKGDILFTDREYLNALAAFGWLAKDSLHRWSISPRGRQILAEYDALRAKAAAGPIERNEDYQRDYVPLPGGWEVQTKGTGSSFRICDTKSGDRVLVSDDYLHPWIERMAREIHAATRSRP